MQSDIAAVTPPRTATNDPSRSPQSAEVAVVPYDLFQVTAPINRQNRDDRSPCHTLARDNAAHAAVVLSKAHAVHENQRAEVTLAPVVGTLKCSGGKPGQGYPTVLTSHAAVVQPMAVRRLTPTECERLQGFPDGWTQIPWKNRPSTECPDGPRYRALGNSMAVPVIRWIARKIEGALP